MKFTIDQLPTGFGSEVSAGYYLNTWTFPAGTAGNGVYDSTPVNVMVTSGTPFMVHGGIGSTLHYDGAEGEYYSMAGQGRHFKCELILGTTVIFTLYDAQVAIQQPAGPYTPYVLDAQTGFTQKVFTPNQSGLLPLFVRNTLTGWDGQWYWSGNTTINFEFFTINVRS